MKSRLSNASVEFDKKLLETENQNNFSLTLKNYNIPMGLSKAIGEDTLHRVFELKGPIGKGLGLSHFSQGTHVAFAAGTGVLVFVDVVARLALQMLDLIPDEDRLSPDFKFVFYASFLSREDGIALEMMETLLELQRALNLD
jgi:hypothetical protein